MLKLTYQSHESLQAIESRDYMTIARMLVFLEHGGLDTPETMREVDLEPWLDEKLGWQIHTGAYRHYWDYLGYWQKFKIPKFVAEEEAELLRRSRTLFQRRIQDYVGRAGLFYAIEQYARHDLFFVESDTDSQLSVRLAKKLTLPLVPYRTRFRFASSADAFVLPEMRRLVQDLFSHYADYFEWYDYGSNFEHLTRSPYAAKMNNSVLYPYTLFRIPSKQLYVTLCPTAPRWLDYGQGVFEDTYRFDAGTETIWRVVNNEPVPFEEVSLAIGSHDHLFRESENSSRAANLKEYAELLLSQVR